MTQLWDTYCDWLLDKVGFVGDFVCGRSGDSGMGRRLHPDDYYILMRSLHSRPFTWKIERDENRMKDGIRLRYDFFDDTGINGGSFGEPCSILEFMVGLAIRLDTEYVGDPGDPHPEELFWQMVCNLGLKEMRDDQFNKRKFDEIIDIWLEREFKINGEGSIFPLKNVTFDSREEEIWKQSMAYLTENY